MTLMGAIKQLHELRSAEDMPVYYKPVIAEVINVLLMDAQEVKHGHWILSEDRYCKTCSECGVEVDVSMGLGIFVDNIELDEMNYCPHCGAKMDEVEDETN